MKKFNILLALFLISAYSFSQAPLSFNYQAIYRDVSGNIQANKSVVLIVSIIQGTIDGTEIFTETHSVKTNDFGLITISVGTGNPTDFQLIDWSNGPFFIKVNVNGTEMGVSQLLSVPFALFAQSVESTDDEDADPTNEIQILSLTENILTLSLNGTQTPIDLEQYLDNTDNQQLSIDGQEISLTNGGVIQLPGPQFNTPVIYSGGCTVYGQIDSDIYCLDGTDFNTSTSYLDIDPSGEITILKPGFYRINAWAVNHGSSIRRILLEVNGNVISDKYEAGIGYVTMSLDETWNFQSGDKVLVRYYNDGGSAYYRWNGTYYSNSRFQIEYIGLSVF